MQCPNCGSWRVERSRRRGAREQWLLPLQATYPFRCGACNARFLVKLWSFGERVKRMKARPPRWVRTLVWVIAVGALGLVVALAMVALNSTSIPTPKAPPPLKK